MRISRRTWSITLICGHCGVTIEEITAEDIIYNRPNTGLSGFFIICPACETSNTIPAREIPYKAQEVARKHPDSFV